MKKDTISKDILKIIIKDIAKYILHFDIQTIELLDMEFERVESRRADIVAKIDNDIILHLEIQNDNNYQMHYRMLRYWLDINQIAPKYQIKQYVIYIGKKNLTMPNQINVSDLNYTYTLIDMKTIDCQNFLQQNTPDALVLAILCDFKQKDPREIVGYIIDQLLAHTKNDIQAFRKYMLMLEELSTNQDLKDIVKEQEMLSTLRYEDLPSYEIGLEKGIEKGMEKGDMKRNYDNAKRMKEEGIDVEVIVRITGLSIETITHL